MMFNSPSAGGKVTEESSQPRQAALRRPSKVETFRTKEKFTVAFVPSVEARAVTVSPDAQEMLVMLEAVLLAASTSSESEVE